MTKKTTMDQSDMGKVIYVMGERGAGKSTLISMDYEGDDFFRLEFPTEFLEEPKATGEVGIDLLIDSYNQVLGDALDAFFDGKSVVIEICMGSDYDSAVLQLVERTKIAGIPTVLAAITCDDDKREVRLIGAEKEPGYFSSFLLLPYVLEIYEGFVDSFERTKKMGYIE